MRGFEYLAYSAVSSVLLFVLVLIPVAPAFASEEVSEGTIAEASAEPESGGASASVEESSGSEPEEDAPVAPTEETEALDPEGLPDGEGEEDISPEGDEPGEDEIIEETLPASEEDVDIVSDAEAESDGEVVSETGVSEEKLVDASEQQPADVSEESVPTENVGTTTDAELPLSDSATTTGEISETLTDDAPEQAAPEEAAEDAVPELEASTTPENLVVIESAETDGNPFSFSENECVSVGDGSFYCSSAEDAPAPLGTDRVFSAVDADGDKEIYVEKGGELTAVTENFLDDDAPYYDERSETIVWHRLIDGRYQIVSYDLETAEETVLTNDRYNNMEPSRYGDVTVWQGWVGNDWEIMLMEDGEITMLTDNTWNDVVPNVNGAYVVWQSFEENAWRVKVYDTITGEVTTIDDAEGASVENPRFVLVYDSKRENGDVETKGFDLERKEAVPLSASPAPVPESIPDPDQTGEDRALIQTVTQLKPKTEGEEDVPDDVPMAGGEPNPTGSTTTPSVISDVVIPPFDAGTTTEELHEEAPAEETAPDTGHIEDVVIPATPATGDASVTDHIEDVTVTPYVEPIEPVGKIEITELD